MKERPILFTGDMVRAILDGRKTQTRRPLKPQPVPFGEDSPFTQATLKEHVGRPWMPVGGVFQDNWKRPLGTVGDRLWVRETWGLCWCGDLTHWAVRGDDITDYWWQVEYREQWGPSQDCCFWRPSIHMPRWASRIDLEITAVCVERVQDITEEDAKKEGMTVTEYYAMSRKPNRSTFIDLWQSIYGTWDANPWVWVYEFRRIKP